MKIYQVEVQTQSKEELARFARLSSMGDTPQYQLNHKTFGSKEKATAFMGECEAAYKTLQAAAGGGRLQSMRFVLKEHEVEA